MRKIKFRAFNRKRKVLLEWKDILKNKELLQSILGNESYATNPRDYLWDVMEYTGLKDKKRTKEYPEGQEIYEEDIVKAKPRKSNIKGVVFDTIPVNCWIQYYVDRFHLRPHGYSLRRYELEVIGNLYENPELINT